MMVTPVQITVKGALSKMKLKSKASKVLGSPFKMQITTDTVKFMVDNIGKTVEVHADGSVTNPK